MSADGLNSPGSVEPLHVLLHVYDVAQGDNKGTVVRLNNLVGPKGLGLGGQLRVLLLLLLLPVSPSCELLYLLLVLGTNSACLHQPFLGCLPPGVFHGAIVLGTVEFSFGFCSGVGVWMCGAWLSWIQMGQLRKQLRFQRNSTATIIYCKLHSNK
jgi:hypothetical protein